VIVITVRDPIIKSEEFAFHSIRFSPAKCLSLSQAISWISKGRGVVDELVWVVIVPFVDIDGIVDNHCLIVHFIKITIIIMKTYVSYSVLCWWTISTHHVVSVSTLTCLKNIHHWNLQLPNNVQQDWENGKNGKLVQDLSCFFIFHFIIPTPECVQYLSVERVTGEALAMIV
jgi:hypothetical protein